MSFILLAEMAILPFPPNSIGTIFKHRYRDKQRFRQKI